MKRMFIMLVILITFSINIFGQYDTVYSKSNINMVRTYTGLRFTPSILIDSLQATTLMSARMGVLATWKPFKLVEIEAIPFGEFSTNGNWAKSFVSIKFGNENSYVVGGYGPTIPATFRPYPYSISGHVEYVGTAIIPGEAFGLRIFHKIGKFGVMAGVAERGLQVGDSVEYSLKIDYNNLSIGGLVNGDSYAGLVRYKSEHFSITSYCSDSIFSGGLDINLSRDLSIIYDFAFVHKNFTSFDSEYFELVLAKNVNDKILGKNVDGLYGIGFSLDNIYRPKSIIIYIVFGF